jgi:hypothetical protein
MDFIEKIVNLAYPVGKTMETIGDTVRDSTKFGKFAQSSAKGMLNSVLVSETTTEIMHGTLASFNLALNIMVGCVVALIITSSIFVFYFIADPEASAKIANINNIVTLSLSMALVLSLIIVKTAFSGLNVVLFDYETGIIPYIKKMTI